MQLSDLMFLAEYGFIYLLVTFSLILLSIVFWGLSLFFYSIFRIHFVLSDCDQLCCWLPECLGFPYDCWWFGTLGDKGVIRNGFGLIQGPFVQGYSGKGKVISLIDSLCTCLFCKNHHYLSLFLVVGLPNNAHSSFPTSNQVFRFPFLTFFLF